MDWKEILNSAVYPALYGLILVILSIGLKALATWLKAQTAKIQNDLLKTIATDAVNSIEQQAAAAEKNGQAKWASPTKKDAAAATMAAEAKMKGLAVTDAEIGHLIESVLGSKK
jgi:hypothetical protein